MDLKSILSYKRSKMYSIGLLAFLLLFITNGSGFKSNISSNRNFIPAALQLSFNQTEKIFKGNDLLSNTESSLDGKFLAYRKKFKQIIEGDDDHSPYVRALQYTRYLPSFVRLNYESPHFISEQQSFLFKLSVF